MEEDMLIREIGDSIPKSWFPGHMAKSMRLITDTVKNVDGIIYVLDARCPLACINKKLIATFNNKKILYLLNKSDLADKKENEKWQKYFEKDGNKCILTEGRDLKYSRAIKDAFKWLMKEKLDRNKSKGVNKPLRFMVCGVTNTGKSTIINNLSNSKRAQTGDKAGVTRGGQWIRLDGLELFDTPGTMPPSFSTKEQARHLAYVGSINDDILDFADISIALLKEIATVTNRELITERLGEIDLDAPLDKILESVCVRRGFFMSKNECDYDRGARAIIDDFRKGKLGRITLEKVDDNDGN